MKHIIFIDFSFNNTAICKYDIAKKTYRYFLLANHFSYTKSAVTNPLSSTGFTHIAKANDLDVSIYKKVPQSRPKGDPSEFCRYMLESCDTVSNLFMYIMNNKVLYDVELGDTIFGIEDYAIAIKSGNVAETAEMVSSCKNELYKLGIPSSNFHFFQPQGIKGVTGNGNATKQMMLDYFIKKNISNNDVHKIIMTNHKFYRKAGNKVMKPVEDIVDTFVGIQAVRNKLNL